MDWQASAWVCLCTAHGMGPNDALCADWHWNAAQRRMLSAWRLLALPIKRWRPLSSAVTPRIPLRSDTIASSRRALTITMHCGHPPCFMLTIDNLSGLGSCFPCMEYVT